VTIWTVGCTKGEGPLVVSRSVAEICVQEQSVVALMRVICVWKLIGERISEPVLCHWLEESNH